MAVLIWTPGDETVRKSAHEPDGGKTTTQTPTSQRIVVVGLGNELLGDDGVGILAARHIQRELSPQHQVQIRELPWAGLGLLDVLRGFDRAILIDALSSDGRYPPGTVLRLTEDDFAGSVRLNSFHDINYPTALALGRAFGWPLPRAIDIFAVEGGSLYEFKTQLSAPVAAALKTVVLLVTQIVRGHCDEVGTSGLYKLAAADVA